MRHSMPGRLLLVVVTLTGLYACTPADEDYLVGTLERDRIELIAERSEPVIKLLARKGDRVESGSLLLQLDASRATEQLSELKALRNQRQRRLDELIRGPRQEVIEQTQAQRVVAAAELENATEELNRLKPLVGSNLVSEAEYERAEAAYQAASGRYEATAAELEAVLDGTTIEVLDQARAQLDAAEAAVARQQVMLERLSIEAPRAARVEALPWKHGSQPPAGAVVAVLVAEDLPYARVYIPAEKLSAYSHGQKVTVQISGFGDYQGQVRWIASEAAFTPYFALTEHDRDRLSYAAEIELRDDRATELPTGIPVTVTPFAANSGN
ncbi:HlyD family secretion protein [Pseudidiomarina sp.]|uniref:HlyD family secretion protein n=1 Tax=Pseudidiomarina sp. TaxID=2081707 RepID=UPI00299F4B99|nr:HlyD family efflux transporter periplasmic adaptor subunit [Pseudidiomarina sp.]MDX1704999.1 HlyD family efflux transporter periplasmic adaptor subunit [Pseudidiomarina sp.]